MDIKTELLREHSKEQAKRIAGYIGKDVERFDVLMSLFLDINYRITQRAAWVLSHCIDDQPNLILPYVEKIVLNLKDETPVAVVRNTVRVLQMVEIPEEHWGITADACFHLLASNSQPVAVKVFSMTVLANICLKVPELKHELKILIEDQMPYGSAGFKSRGKKVLKLLEKLVD